MKYTLCGIEFNLTDDDTAGAAHVFNRGREEANDLGPSGMVAEMESFIRRTESLRSLVDVGALFGIFSLVFTGRKDARSVAIEPSDMAFPILLQQCEANPEREILPVKAFAGEVSGRGIQCSKDWKHVVADEGGGTEWHQNFLGKPITDERVEVKETRIDDMRLPFIDCMKIDVEGWECAVLRGAKETILEYRPLIFLEAHLTTLEGHGESGASLWEILKNLEYAIERLDGTPMESFDGENFTRVVCTPK